MSPTRGDRAGDEEQRVARQERRHHQAGLAEHDDEEQPVDPGAVLLHELPRDASRGEPPGPRTRREAPSVDCIIVALPRMSASFRRPDQSPSVERVRDALSRAGMEPAIVELPGAARTAKAAADFLGCEIGQIANSLVFRAEASDGAVLVMSSGAKRVDVARLAALARRAGRQGRRRLRAQPDRLCDRRRAAGGARASNARSSRRASPPTASCGRRPAIRTPCFACPMTSWCASPAAAEADLAHEPDPRAARSFWSARSPPAKWSSARLRC